MLRQRKKKTFLHTGTLEWNDKKTIHRKYRGDALNSAEDKTLNGWHESITFNDLNADG